MDILRSCYEVDMQLRSDSDAVTRVRWHWASPGAKPLPFPTAFASRNWLPDKDREYPVGERRDSKRPYRRCQCCTARRAAGRPHGSPAVWSRGGTADDPTIRVGLVTCEEVKLKVGARMALLTADVSGPDDDAAPLSAGVGLDAVVRPRAVVRPTITAGSRLPALTVPYVVGDDLTGGVSIPNQARGPDASVVALGGGAMIDATDGGPNGIAAGLDGGANLRGIEVHRGRLDTGSYLSAIVGGPSPMADAVDTGCELSAIVGGPSPMADAVDTGCDLSAIATGPSPMADAVDTGCDLSAIATGPSPILTADLGGGASMEATDSYTAGGGGGGGGGGACPAPTASVDYGTGPPTGAVFSYQGGGVWRTPSYYIDIDEFTCNAPTPPTMTRNGVSHALVAWTATYASFDFTASGNGIISVCWN